MAIAKLNSNNEEVLEDRWHIQKTSNNEEEGWQLSNLNNNNEDMVEDEWRLLN